MDQSIDQLDNPVWSALLTGNKWLALGEATAKVFAEDVSSFAGVAGFSQAHFDALGDMVIPGQKKLFFTIQRELGPQKWRHIDRIDGFQMMYKGPSPGAAKGVPIAPLADKDVPAMLALTKLSPPGPFLNRTIAFGGYEGIFHGEQLVAMAGRRFFSGPFVEISAVCTHPDHTGQGYARELMNNQIRKMLLFGLIPYLHVRADNTRALEIYKRMRFEIRTDMFIHVLERQ